jgi:hypothetical protein
MAVSSFRPLALRACSEVQAGLGALSSIAIMAPEPEPSQLLSDGQRCAARVANFLYQALGALDPYTDISFPPLRRRLSRYDSPHRVMLAMEGGCTRVGWQARVEEQRLAGVRALYIAIGAALADDIEQLVDLGPVLDEQLSKHGRARQYLEAFQLGLGRLTGLLELLADTRRVVCYTAPDGRRLMDLFQSAEPG